MDRFLAEEKNRWRRLEELLDNLRGRSLRGLSRVEAREFGELYRRAAADLAIARAETRDPKLINYLNSLVIRAHGKLYRAESEGTSLIWRFISHDLPATFRRNARYTALAFAVFFIFSLFSGLLAYNDPEFGQALGLEDARVAAETDTRWWLRINEANQIESSDILTNNIQVAFNAFALGACFGVGALFILMFNAAHIGGVLGVCFSANANFGRELVTFMVGHGVIELSCIFMAAGAGMMIGYALIDPGDMTRAQALRVKGIEAARIVIGCAVLLVIAGIIEGFLSPSALPATLKYVTGIGTGIALYSYLLFAGRDTGDSEATELERRV